VRDIITEKPEHKTPVYDSLKEKENNNLYDISNKIREVKQITIYGALCI
jgi:hypothetical protein